MIPSSDSSSSRGPWTSASEWHYTVNAVGRAPEACREALFEYARWLEEERGLAASSITVRVSSARHFLGYVVGPAESVAEAFGELDARGIEDFFVEFCTGHGCAARRSMQSTMRLFLRFAASRGWCRSEFVRAVPSLRSYGLSHVPRAISNVEIGRLLKSLSADGSCARDRAIVLLLVGYGVRRAQVSALQLDDVRWRDQRILFRRHKGGKDVEHSLTAAIAEAMALYLRDERPPSGSRFVFLRRNPPHLQLSPSAITEMVRARLLRLGVEHKPLGPHALRHAFASRMLCAGQPLKVIADLLGHRSLSSTAVYAKIDHPRLIEVALEWPEVAS